MKVQQNVLLKNHTTFRIGGRARYFIETKSADDLIKAIKLAKEKNLPFFILGQGSNVLIKEAGFKGIIIKIKNSDIGIKEYKSKFKIFCQSGVSLSNIVFKSLKIGATGTEWAAGIPGTVGGAIYGNAGAFGYSIADNLESVTVLDSNNLTVKTLKKDDCFFGYRQSIFQKKKNLIILGAVLKLNKEKKENISKKIEKNIREKRKNQPLNFPSAGCIFKNPQRIIKDKKLLKKFPQLAEFNIKGAIPAGWLIEKCGLKGKKIGGAQISSKHANFIVNLGSARSNDVEKLISIIKKEVKKRFNIGLVEEIQIMNEI